MIVVHYALAVVHYALIAGGGGLAYIIDEDARQNLQKKSLKVTIVGVAPANFIP